MLPLNEIHFASKDIAIATFAQDKDKEQYFKKLMHSQDLTKDLPETNYFKSNYVDKEYMNFHITGIRQFQLSNNKKVDLIISDFGNIEFLSTFDFFSIII